MIRLCTLSELPEGQSRGFHIDDKPIFAVNSQQRIYVFRNRCPHLGIELEWVQDQFLNDDASLIQCSTHGALFTIEDGRCVAGPCLGEHLQTIPSRIDGDHVVIEQVPD